MPYKELTIDFLLGRLLILGRRQSDKYRVLRYDQDRGMLHTCNLVSGDPFTFRWADVQWNIYQGLIEVE
jgi:hypothetical protein